MGLSRVQKNRRRNIRGSTGGGLPAPTISSLDYDLADSAGGDTITVTGTNFVNGAVVAIGVTNATTNFVNSTTLTFTMPAKSAGTYNVKVTNPDTQNVTLTNGIEAWSPADISSIRQFWERPDYTSGTWTKRVGNDLTEGTNPPTATSGSPVFDGTNDRLGLATELATVIGNTNAATVAAVLNPTSKAADAGEGVPYNNNWYFGVGTNGTFGCWYNRTGGAGTDLMYFHVYDGTAYKIAKAPCTPATYHAVVNRYTDSGSPGHVSVSVDGDTSGAGFDSEDLTVAGSWALSVGALVVGESTDGSRHWPGTMRALVVCSGAITDAETLKFYKWSRSRHGVA